MRSFTHAAMMARSGNMQTLPMTPVNVTRVGAGPGSRPFMRSGVADTVIMEGSGTDRKRAIVAYAHPRTQGADRAAARAARRVSVLRRGGRHDLCGEGAGAARPCPHVSRR